MAVKQYKALIKDWIKITALEILPIFWEAMKKLTSELLKAYDEKEINALKELKEIKENADEQKKQKN